MIRTWQELVEASHGMAKEKGWWDKPRDMATMRCLFHSEISEAFEEYRKGSMDTYLSVDKQGRDKPEGFWVEIADLLIRLADACGGMPDEFKEAMECLEGCALVGWNDSDDFTGFCSLIHQLVAFNDWQNLLYDAVFFAEENGVNIWSVCKMKMAYNAGRPHRHGGKIA